MGDGYEEFFSDIDGDVDMGGEDDVDEAVYPCVSLTDIFDRLADKPVLPVVHRFLPGGPGWTCGDLGGDGLCLGDAFNMSTEEGTPGSTPGKASDLSNQDPISAAELATVHPNKVFALAIQYINSKAPQLSQTQRSQKHKAPQWLLLLRTVIKNPLIEFTFNVSWRQRTDAYYMLTAWLSRLSGRSIREVRVAIAPVYMKEGKWKQYDDKVKCRFHFLKELEKCDEFQKAFPELCESRVNGRSSQTSFAMVAASETNPVFIQLCYGYLATYNTPLGLYDPTILQWVQQGLRGSELAAKLKTRDLLKDAFPPFVEFHKELAAKFGFASWAVAMEHSENAQNPARVHLHVYAGTDIRGGFMFMGTPKPTAVLPETLQWDGCSVPKVRFTIIRRPSPSTILNGVATGMYYVAGSKKSNLFLQASMYPFEDQTVSGRTQSYTVPETLFP